MRFGMMMENRHMKKIRKVIKFLSKKLNILQEKVNMLYVAISILVVVAIGALIGSCWMPESYNDVKNIVVGLSTGIITSALVTVYIENINARMDKKRKVRYKQMLLNPLYMSIDRLYKRLILNINEYRVREEYVGYYFLPIKETKEISEFFDITIYYSNSNIYPDTEYFRRFHELENFIQCFNQDFNQNIQVVEKEYQPKEYLKDISQYKDEPEGGKRCYLCYSKRMKDAYDYASLHHFDYWTTVLSVSPHKNSQWINEIGASFPQEKTQFLFSDFKKNNGYLKSVKFAALYNLYRQNYCGCVYSYQDMLEREKNKEL